MRGMKHVDTAKMIMEGFRTHYNYFRPHESLATKTDASITPAKKAGIDLKYDTWLGLIKSESNQIEEPKTEPIEFTQITFDKGQYKRKWERERKRRKREAKRQLKRESIPTILVSRK
jgi:hypothetical protein